MPTTPRVLLLGGHGKISQLLTPLLLANHHVTSVIRDPAQKSTIAALGASHSKRLDVLIRDLADIRTQTQAQEVISSTDPDYIIWSAGAGGLGGAERTFAIDRDACIAFINATVATEKVTKFLLISYLGSRHAKAPWWSNQEWDSTREVNQGALKNYHAAKVTADRCLTGAGKQRGSGFAAISLRPGTLTDDDGAGAVSLGRIGAIGKVARQDVAAVAVELLEKDAQSCWLDLLAGDEVIHKAVDRCVKEGVDCVEGENVENTEKDEH